MDAPDLLPLDAVQMRNIWAAYRNHPTVGCCVQAIRNCVFGGGIRFRDSQHADLKMHYEKLAQNALDWIICVGVVPMMVHPVTDAKGKGVKLLPVVPQPEAVKLFVRLDEFGQRKFIGMLEQGNSILSSVVTGQLHDDQAKKAVVVWSGGEYLPTARGKMVTPITHLETNERFLTIMRENVLVASMLQANPTLISRTVSRANADNDGVMWNVDEQTVEAAETDRLQRLANTTQKEFSMHQQHWGEGGIPTTREELSDFAKRCHPREYFLAQDRDLVRPSEPTMPANYTEIMRYVFKLRMKRQVEQFLQEAMQLCSALHDDPAKLTEDKALWADTQSNPTPTGQEKQTVAPQKQPDATTTFLSIAEEPRIQPPQPTKQQPQQTLEQSSTKEGAPSAEDSQPRKRAKHEQGQGELPPVDFDTPTVESDKPKELVLLPGVPCISQGEIQAMRENGYLSREEAGNAVRSMLGMGLVSDATIKRQKADYDKDLVAQEKALAQARASAQPPGQQAPSAVPSTKGAPPKEQNGSANRLSPNPKEPKEAKPPKPINS